MRKQTKLAAVTAAAALLAIGASMTSFAATGWVEEDGVWCYYDKDGNRVTDEWKKSGDNWYWLNGEDGGAMATDFLVEDGSDTYYVDSTGVMVKNTWVKVVNEDQDDDTDPAEYRYYYMQSNGKAYKSDTFSKKTIDGKKYAFDSDGKMLYGWVDKETNSLMSEDDGWKTATNYFGSWEDGAMKTNWQFLNVYDGWDNEDEDAEYWFYFGSNGVKRTGTSDADDTVRINGSRYAFTADGEMYYKWLAEASASDTASASAWKYFNSAEEGARKTKGWFKVTPKKAFDVEMSSDGNDEAQWYYADSDGSLKVSEISKIKGKYYGFDEYGAMLSGLVHMSVDDNGVIDAIYAKENDNRDADTSIDADYLDDLKDGKITNPGTLYYFGNPGNVDSDGALKTGNVSMSVDGSSYTFNFSTSGGVGNVGAGKNGITKKVYYKYGMKMSANSEDKYRAADVDSDDSATFVTRSEMLSLAGGSAQTVVYNEGKSSETKIKYYDLTGKDLYLIGTNGKVKTKANGVKDGEDWYFFSDSEGKVTYYADDKNVEKAIEQNK
ncbi:MAG: cell wall-binding protein [Lachnospiraceae bacterium]|nr:cell wall-binding protein [Lachnospiraceae bacterium]